MDVSLTQLRSKLAQGLRGGCFFLHGSDAFLKSEAVPWIVDAHLDPGSREFNLEVLRSDAATAETLSAAVATPPIAAPYRAIVLKDVQELIPSARSALESLLGRLPPDVALVTTAEIPKGSKAKFYDALRKAGVAVRCEPPPESALPGWLMERAEAQHGLNLEPDAAALLVSSFGRALGALAEELEKLADYVAPRERIGVEDVRAVAGALPRTTRWGWIDLVLDREFDRARDELRSLLDSGESGVGLVAGLGEALVRVGLAAGGGGVLERALKREGAWRYLHWKVPALRSWAAAWPPPVVERALAECLRTDRLLKSGGLGDGALLEELLLRLAAEARPVEAAAIR